MTKHRWVWATALCSILAVALAFAVGTLVRSPWDEAVANSEREPVVTAAVQWRTIVTETPTLRGAYSAGNTTDIAGPVVEGGGVVTAQTVKRGDTVESGTLLGEVSGRPVIALVTPFRLYRDLYPGDSGPDVKALQDALSDLGYYTGVSDGAYGAGTAAAVRAMYERDGYAPPVDPEAVETLALVKEGQADASAPASDGESSEGADSREGADGSAEASVRSKQSAADELAAAQFAALPMLRSTEIVRLHEPQATVREIATVGAELGGGSAGEESLLMRLSGGKPSVTVRVGVASAERFDRESAVEVYALTDHAAKAAGIVSEVSEFLPPNPENGANIPGYDVTVEFSDSPSFDDGDTVVVEPSAAESAGAEGLAIPLAALRDDSEGRYVTRADGTTVPVTIGTTGDGYVLVEGALNDGDEVVVAGTPPTRARE